MTSVGVGVPLLLLVFSVLVRQHAVQGDDDILKLRALKVPDYDHDDRQNALNDLFNVVVGSDVTALMWTNRTAAARDANPLLYSLKDEGFSYSVETSNDSAYSFYYSKTTFSNVYTEYINLDFIEQLFVATFEFADFDGGFLPLTALSTNILKLPQLGSYFAKYRDYPFILFGKFGSSILKTSTDRLQEQTERFVLSKEKEHKHSTTRSTLLLNGMVRSLINVWNQDPNLLGLRYITLCPVYSTFNLTVLKNELSAVPRKLQPVYPRRHIEDVPTGHPSLWMPTFGQSDSHPTGRGQPVEALRGLPGQQQRSPRMTSSDWSYDHNRPTSSGVYPDRNRASSYRALPPARSPVREPQDYLDQSSGMTSPVQLHVPGSDSYHNSPRTVSDFDTIGDSSSIQHAVYGDVTLRVRALKVIPFNYINRFAALNYLYRVVQGSDIAVLMWTDRGNAADANDILHGLNKDINQYSVKTSSDSAYSFYYKSKMFRNVSIQLITIDEIADAHLSIATFEWTDLLDAPFSVAAYCPSIIQTQFANDLDSYFRQYYEDTSLVLLSNFITEHSNPVTRPILFMNSMSTSLIRHFNPRLIDDLQYYFKQPPLYLEFNMTELRKPPAFAREPQQDKDGASRPTPTGRNLDYSSADRFHAATSTQRDFSPRRSPQPTTVSSASVHTPSSSHSRRSPIHAQDSYQFVPAPSADSTQLPVPRVRSLSLKRKRGEGWKIVDSTSAGNGSPASGVVRPLSPVQAGHESRNPRKMYLRQLQQSQHQ